MQIYLKPIRNASENLVIIEFKDAEKCLYLR